MTDKDDKDDDDSPNSNTPPVAAARPDDPLGKTFMKAEVATAEVVKNLKELGKAFENAAGTFGSLPILKLKNNPDGSSTIVLAEKKNPFKWDHPAKTPEKPPQPDWIVSGALTIGGELYEKWRKEHGARSRKKSEERPTETKKSKWITEG